MMSSFGEESEARQGKEDLLNMESCVPISHFLNDPTQNGGISPNLVEIAPTTSFRDLDAPLSSGYSRGSRRAASSILAVQRDGDSPETFCEPKVGGFKDGGNPLAEKNGNFQMSPDPAGCNFLFFCGNDESASESLEPSSEGWMAECLNDVEIPSTSDDLNALGEFDYHFDISELTNLLQADIDAAISQPETLPFQLDMDAENLPPQIIPLIGENKAGAKKAKAVLYPFAVVKPCGVQGDTTLTDINRRISSTFTGIPHVKECSSSQPMHTSAFTGKPVVSRTKVHTEGNGSIIIIRTRG